MANPALAPVRIRVARPFESEDDFIHADAARVSRATIVLADAAEHPVGRIVRFEVVLANGTVVLRGEGPVVAFYASAGPRPAGLEVKIQRFDAHSKVVLDRMCALRSAGAHSSRASLGPRPVVSRAPAPLADEPAGPRASSPPREVGSGARVPQTFRVPTNRDEILERLRVRARTMREAGGFSYKTLK